MFISSSASLPLFCPTPLPTPALLCQKEKRAVWFPQSCCLLPQVSRADQNTCSEQLHRARLSTRWGGRSRSRAKCHISHPVSRRGTAGAEVTEAAAGLSSGSFLRTIPPPHSTHCVFPAGQPVIFVVLFQTTLALWLGNQAF